MGRTPDAHHRCRREHRPRPRKASRSRRRMPEGSLLAFWLVAVLSTAHFGIFAYAGLHPFLGVPLALVVGGVWVWGLAVLARRHGLLNGVERPDPSRPVDPQSEILDALGRAFGGQPR